MLCGSNSNLSTCVNPDLYGAFKLKSVPLNQYTGKTDYFQLTIIGPNGGLCPCFPTNETSDFYWQYLPDKAAAEAAAAANAALQQQPATALTQIVHSPPVTPAKNPLLASVPVVRGHKISHMVLKVSQDQGDARRLSRLSTGQYAATLRQFQDRIGDPYPPHP